jgi:hypothetical protein
VAFGYRHNGDRGLGRQALRITDEVAIEHDVSHHHDPAALHAVNELDDPIPCEGRR